MSVTRPHAGRTLRCATCWNCRGCRLPNAIGGGARPGRPWTSADLDCIVLWGWPAVWDFCTANARYLSPIGGNAEFNVLVFPRRGDPTSFVMMPTFVEGWRIAQDWVADVRAKRGTWADTVADRLNELGLRRRPHRHGWTGWTTRSRRLAAAQRVQQAGSAVAAGRVRQSG